MKREPYQRQKGDFEIRILPDGRLVFVAPDEKLILLSQMLEQKDSETEKENLHHE